MRQLLFLFFSKNPLTESFGFGIIIKSSETDSTHAEVAQW